LTFDRQIQLDTFLYQQLYFGGDPLQPEYISFYFTIQVVNHIVGPFLTIDFGNLRLNSIILDLLDRLLDILLVNFLDDFRSDFDDLQILV